MNHPFLNHKKFFFIYLLLWMLIMTIHSFFLYLQVGISMKSAIIDSIIFNFTFGFLGIFIWYPVNYYAKAKSPLINRIINQIIIAILFLMIWSGLCISLLKHLLTSDLLYMVFLEKSMPLRFFSGIFYFMTLFLIYYVLIYYVAVQEKIVAEARIKDMLKETELNMLKSQINPHFLFNSLNSVSSLTLTNPQKAQEMVVKLSEYLRYSVSEPKGNLTSLTMELKNIHKYLEIEKVRFGDKLQYNFDVDDACLEKRLPPMILQPLYENAIKHGVYESTETVAIKTSIQLNSGGMTINIENNYDPTAIVRRGAGIGIKNIRERLSLVYKNDSLLKTINHGNTFVVELFIPVDF